MGRGYVEPGGNCTRSGMRSKGSRMRELKVLRVGVWRLLSSLVKFWIRVSGV